MAHNLEERDGRVSMAYAGLPPWHTLGKPVPKDLTPMQMCEAAGVLWTVEKIPAFATVAGKKIPVGKSALIRNVDNKILDIVSDDWNPVQNQEAFEFFNEFVMAGKMHMETAGSLKGGQIVWCLARVDESFEAVKGDRVDSHLLFTNFHKYGHSTDVRFTPIRVVCDNTLTLALSTSVARMAKISHRRVFKADDAKEMVGVAHDKLSKYKEMAQFLGSKKAKAEDIVTFFKKVFPVSGTNTETTKDISKNAALATQALTAQPGTKFAPGTWWQPFNAVTFVTDHYATRNPDNRLQSAWYGYHKGVKEKALKLALEMASQ